MKTEFIKKQEIILKRNTQEEGLKVKVTVMVTSTKAIFSITDSETQSPLPNQMLMMIMTFYPMKRRTLFKIE